MGLFEVGLVEFEYSPVFVCPAGFLFEAMVFYWIDCDFPVFFAEFDEALCEAYCVLEVDVCVNHAVAD